MTLEELTQHTSPYLLCRIDLAVTPRHLTTASDLKRVKRLADKNFPVPHSAYTRAKPAYRQDL